MVEIIRLVPKAPFIQRFAKTPVGKVITSPVTTAVLGTTLATILAPAAVGRLALGAVKFVTPKTPRGVITAAVLVPTTVGVLTASPTARGFVKGVFDPRKQVEKGKAIGGIIEDPSKLLPKDKTIREKVTEVAKGAGLVAGGAALAAGIITAVPKIKEKLAREKVPTALLPTMPTITPSIQPFGAVEKPKVEPLPSVTIPKVQPSIKNVFNPSIDIRFSKTRKFINQQVLIR